MQQIEVFSLNASDGVWSQTSSQLCSAKTLADGTRLVVKEEISAPGGGVLITAYTFDENPGPPASPNKAYRKLLSRINPDGSWFKYEYDAKGRICRTSRPWLSSPAGPAEASLTNCHLIVNTYTEPAAGVDAEEGEMEYVLGIKVRETVTTITTTATTYTSTRVRKMQRINDNNVLESYESISSSTYALDPAGVGTRLIRSVDEAGVVTEYRHLRGVFNMHGEMATGPYPEASKRDASIVIGPLRSSDGRTVAKKTVRRLLIRNASSQADTIFTFVALATGQDPDSATYQLMYVESFSYDNQKRLTSHTSSTSVWGYSYVVEQRWYESYTEGGQLRHVIYRTGPKGEILFEVTDSAGRTLAHGRQPTPPSFPTFLSPYAPFLPFWMPGSSAATVFAEGADNTTVKSSWDSDVGATSSVTDFSGRLVRTTDELGRVVDHSYSTDGLVMTETHPGGRTVVTTRHRDGRLASITGTGVDLPEFHEYSVDADGTMSETIHYGTDSGPRWVKTVRNGEGMELKVERPSPSGAGTVIDFYQHDDAGRLIRASHAGLASQLTTYDDLGAVKSRGSDMNPDGELTVVSTDRFTEYDTFYSVTPSGVTRVTVETAYTSPTGSNPAVTTRKTQIGTGMQSSTTSQAPDGRVTYDGFDQQRYGLRHISGGNVEEGDTRYETAIYQGGRLAAMHYGLQSSYQFPQVHYIYDENGRFAGTPTSPETRDVLTGLLLSDKFFQYEYYPASHVNGGQLKKKTSMDGGVTNYTYDTVGRLLTQSGAGSYPIEREYDDYGHLHKLKTWRKAGTPPDVTTWTYSAATGLLERKTDPAGRQEFYTYYASGLLHTSTNARGITKTYTYDLGGHVKTVSYSDSTVGIEYTRDRLGRVTTVKDGTANQNLFYNGLGGDLSRVLFPANGTANVPGVSLLYSEAPRVRSPVELPRGRTISVMRGLVEQLALRFDDLWGLMNLRSAGLKVEMDVASTQYGPKLVRYSTGTGYKVQGEVYFSEGRANGLRWMPVNDDGSAFTFPIAMSSGTEQRAKEYFQWIGEQDVMGRFSDVKMIPLMNAGELGASWTYHYNLRSEVSEGKMFELPANYGASYYGGTNPLPQPVAWPGREVEYEYDEIGNRTTAERKALIGGGADVTTYSSNELNQYTSLARSNPLHRLIEGAAHAQATVEVRMRDPLATGTQMLTVARVEPGGEGFVSEGAISLGVEPQWREVEITALGAGVGVGGGVASTTRRGWLYMPPLTEEPQYDDCGNLIEDARWTYRWDAENRLAAQEEKVRSPALEALEARQSPPERLRLEYGYDYQGRRVRKVVKQRDRSAGTWVVTRDRRFIYDKWNVLAEFEAVEGVAPGGVPRLVRGYGWGVDLSGTSQGAGGVGGLVLVHEYPATQSATTTPVPVRTLAPFYDGNGNVLAYVDIMRREVTHRFQYDPFGNELGMESLLEGGGSTEPEPPPHRFSTKYTDRETGDVYYGYRSLRPAWGRWPSRDPIGERGGVNLYGMVGNDPINYVDPDGLVVLVDDAVLVGLIGAATVLSYFATPDGQKALDAAGRGICNAAEAVCDALFVSTATKKFQQAQSLLLNALVHVGYMNGQGHGQDPRDRRNNWKKWIREIRTRIREARDAIRRCKESQKQEIEQLIQQIEEQLRQLESQGPPLS